MKEFQENALKEDKEERNERKAAAKEERNERKAAAKVQKGMSKYSGLFV